MGSNSKIFANVAIPLSATVGIYLVEDRKKKSHVQTLSCNANSEYMS